MKGEFKCFVNICVFVCVVDHAQRADKSKVDKTAALVQQTAIESDITTEDDVDIMTSSAKRFRPDVPVEPEIFSRSMYKIIEFSK